VIRTSVSLMVSSVTPVTAVSRRPFAWSKDTQKIVSARDRFSLRPEDTGVREGLIQPVCLFGMVVANPVISALGVGLERVGRSDRRYRSLAVVGF
jgi:hypothetical protein